MFKFYKKAELPTPETALPGHEEKTPVLESHYVNGHSLAPPFPQGVEKVLFGMGCFWGAERKFWQAQGVYTTAVGYAGGYTPNPTYQEVCTGMTGHAEVVLVVYDPKITSYSSLLKIFWESHDPTQGMRQGNDVGTQYRSAIYTYNDEQKTMAEASKAIYAEQLQKAGYGSLVATEIRPASEFYYAEPYHQQYLAKNPTGYCGLSGTGVNLSALPQRETSLK